MLIRLENARRIAEGTKRWVYVHPDDPALLIKVVKPTTRLKYQWARDLRWKYVHSEVLLRELREHMLLRAEDPNPPDFLEKIVGFADTDLGLGYVVKAERDRDGRYAQTLSKLLGSGRFDSKAREELDIFFANLRAATAIVGDLTSRNMVWAYTPERGEHFVLVDGLGDKGWPPFQRIGWIARRAKERGIARIERQVTRVAAASSALPAAGEPRMTP